MFGWIPELIGHVVSPVAGVFHNCDDENGKKENAVTDVDSYKERAETAESELASMKKALTALMKLEKASKTKLEATEKKLEKAKEGQASAETKVTQLVQEIEQLKESKRGSWLNGKKKKEEPVPESAVLV